MFNLFLNKRNIFFLSIVFSNVFADKINSVTLVLPVSACDELVNDGTGDDVQASNGQYTLTNYYNYTKSNYSDPSYTCYTITGESRSTAISSLSGTFANIDPRSWVDPVWGGISLKVDGNPVPCTADDNMNIAYAADPFDWCSKISGYGHSSGNGNTWWVNTPNVTLSSDWQSIYLLLEEWGMDHSYDNPWHNIWLNVSHAYKSLPTPSPDLNSIMLLIHGNSYTNNYSFNLFDENGSWTGEVASSPSSSSAWYRVGTSNNVSTLDPVEIDIGMSKDSIDELKSADYTCNFTMTTSPQGPSITNTLDDLIFTNSNYSGYLFFENARSSLVYTPNNNSVTFTLNAKCTSSDTSLPEIDFSPQTLTLYRIKHF